MKKILVMPVKNEEWILEKTLGAAQLWADHIIVADQQSTDSTREICKKFSKVTVVENRAEFHTSTVRKLLLDAARNFEGNNVIFSFDADEIPTAHILDPEFWDHVCSLTPGTAIELDWINLWRSPLQYRNDGSVWSPHTKQFAFIDDRTMEYETSGVINDHTVRVPLKALQKIKRFNFPKVLHYQFTDWERMSAKQSYYRLSEFLQSRQGIIDALRVNAKYGITKETGKIIVAPVPPQWVEVYKQLGIDLSNIEPSAYNWFSEELSRLLREGGVRHIQWLDIGDVAFGRGTLVKFYLRHERFFSSILKVFHSIIFKPFTGHAKTNP